MQSNEQLMGFTKRVALAWVRLALRCGDLLGWGGTRNLMFRSWELTQLDMRASSKCPRAVNGKAGLGRHVRALQNPRVAWLLRLVSGFHTPNSAPDRLQPRPPSFNPSRPQHLQPLKSLDLHCRLPHQFFPSFFEIRSNLLAYGTLCFGPGAALS